jgi:CHAT domain-containing protein/tetratricopeptide (TPR) repeat protein
MYRAAVQHNKGVVLQGLAESLEGLSRQKALQAALTCHEDAIMIYLQGNDTLSWAREQGERGNVLNELSNLFKGAKKLEILHAALDAYDAALTIYTCEATPAEWAMVQNNKGNTLYSLADLLKGAETLQASLTCCNDALKVYNRQEVPALWATTQNTRGNTLRALAELQGGVERAETLRLSIACFDAALLEYQRGGMSTPWAKTRHNKAIALYLQAQLLSGMERIEVLQAAIACYDDALTLYTREATPTPWAMILNNKSIVLHSLAELLGGRNCIEVLRTAINCCDDALSVFTYEGAPDSWAMVQSNKGDGLRHLARWLNGAERTEALYLAITCYDAAFTVYTREGASGDWARTQNNKGVALRNLARLLTGTERVEKLRAAIVCYDDALIERQREVTPLDWAATQSSKGNVLSDLAELLKGGERARTLQAAIACFDMALRERRREVSPGNWAKTQNSKGVTLRHLARLLEEAEQREMLQGAITCFDEALLECHREDAPVDWAMVQSNKGVVLSDLAELLEGSEKIKMLEGAIACFDAALLQYRRDIAPIDWALSQNNKGNVLCDLAQMLDDIQRAQVMQTAISCIDASLTIYTREVLPVDHHRITQSMGMLLFKDGDWLNAARYLGKALDALDDLFTLEVTSRGRQATLITSADLTAHLAYALVRAGGTTNAWQAAEALERGRARATGEAMARQEAQLVAAQRLAPELLERFREASHRLAAITLKNSVPTITLETMSITEGTAETQVPLELAAMSVLYEQLAGYAEAREARTAYDEVVAIIRQEMPDFLRQDGVFEGATKDLRADERLAYVATTPTGAVSLLIGASGDGHDRFTMERLWDERLTSTLVTHLLVGSPGGDGKQQGASIGLLTAQAHGGRLRRALRASMQTLGAFDGVLTRLATCCRAASVRRLVCVPCGLLGLLPLHAALVPISSTSELTEPLVDVVQVSYAPSARIWARGRRRAINSPVEKTDALIVGDPQPQSRGTPPLPGARDEAQAISALMPQTIRGRVSMLTGEVATLSGVLDVLRGQCATLTHAHFACHGLAELSNPQASGMLLAHGARLMARDLLAPTAAHFARLRLVALSACRTALVGTELPDEAIGLPAAWLQAGAECVLASLWPISDSKTLAMMTKFYELHLLDGCEPVDALWLAQRWLRGLPGWQEDCRAAGAVRAAEGPEASGVISALNLAREEAVLRDDLEDRDGDQHGGDAMAAEIPDEKTTARRGDGVKQQNEQYAQHWAAFVIYGS